MRQRVVVLWNKPGQKQVARFLVIWPRGVTVSTLDSESSDRGSNPREALLVLSNG